MGRTRQVVSTMALVAVLSLAGVRVLHSDPLPLRNAVAKATTADSILCYLCDGPDSAIVRPITDIAPPRTSEHGLHVPVQSAITRDDDIPLHVRPPPVI